MMVHARDERIAFRRLAKLEKADNCMTKGRASAECSSRV